MHLEPRPGLFYKNAGTQSNRKLRVDQLKIEVIVDFAAFAPGVQQAINRLRSAEEANGLVNSMRSKVEEIATSILLYVSPLSS